MKLSTFYLFLILAIFSSYSSAAVLTLGGKVVDAQTQEPLPGAVITLPDLRISVVTNEKGEFSFTNIPSRGRFLVEVKSVGYKVLTQTIDLSSSSTINFALQPSVIEVQEVIVTGTFSSTSKKNSNSVSSVTKEDLSTRPSGNIIDAISRVAGVSQITTGNAISKPVIRGLSSNRVVTVSNGVKQEGQQFGDEHGIEVDQFSADRIEVLRGPASLLYGSDALGGVINILDPIPVPNGEIRGEITSNYNTNNGLIASSAMLQGNEKGFIYRGRGTFKNAYSFKTPIGYFPNSGYNETDFSGQIGLNKIWGYTHLDFSSYRNNIGFYEPTVNSIGDFLNENGGAFTESQLKHRTLSFPKQDVRHYKMALNSNFQFGSTRLKSTLGYQHNLRRELSEPNATAPNLFLDLNTYNYDLKYYFAEKNGWEPVIGTAGQFQKSNNTSGLETLIPSYRSQDLGGFFYLKKTWPKTTVNGGIRLDHRKITGDSFTENNDVKFPSFNNNFSRLSGALGFTQEFNDNFNIKANVGSAFRSPNIAELSSNGVHEGAFRYEIGNPKLNPEQSYQLDGTFGFDNSHVNASLGGFVNYINQYIYYKTSNNETIDVGGQNFPVYRFVQNSALLRGVEASLTLHPVKYIHIDNTFSYTKATNRTLNKPLPFIPAAALRNEIRLEPQIAGTRKSYFSIGMDNFFKQTRVDDFETPTSGYTLFNAGLGTTLLFNKQPITVYLSGKNIFNTKYYDHLSRLKPGRLDLENPTFGIYNPGRNLTFGVYVPLILKKEKN